MSIALKVNIARTGAVKTLQFDPSLSIGEIIRDIKERVGEGGSDHGLFLEGDDFRIGKWLDAKKTCNFYDLRSGDTITFKKKHRPIKIALIDGSTKTILVDDSNLVTDMIAVICSHINIPNSEEYGLRGPDQADHEWLNPQQTLREQGIVDSDVIILRKRFFYSDANVDTTDPYALNLLYQECREAIIMGRYPCNENEATQFAALQCQVTLGNNNPQRHKPGYLSLSEYVPEEYRRAGKKLEKKVYVEHRKLLNMTEVNAKYRYVQLCRSLTTYGVTFFHVEEQLVDARGKKKKGKVVARLLGITRDKIVRMDTMTKEVLQSFPLTHLRRWAASGNSFTFDFGDYHEAYYTVQTPDGEQISQVISGYIDIILKRQRDAAAYVADSDDEQVVEEEDLSSMRAQAITSSRGGMGKASEMALSRAGLVTAQGLQSGMSRGQAVYGNVGEGGPGGAASKWKGEFSRGQAGELESFTPANSDVLRAAGLGGLLNDLEGAFNAVNAACNQLAVPISRAPMSDDPAAERWRKQELQGARQQLRVQCNGMTVATAQIVSSTVCNDADDFNPDMLADACKALGGHITQLATLGRQAASLSDEMDADELLDACQALGGATKRLVGAANAAAGGLAQGIVDPEVRDEILDNAQQIGTEISRLLQKAGAGDVDTNNQNKLFEATNKVAAEATKVVGQAKSAANTVQGQANKTLITNAAKGVWTGTSQLVSVVKVVAPTISNPKSLEQLALTVQAVKGYAGKLQGDAEAAGASPAQQRQLQDAVNGLDSALADLVNQARTAGEKPDYTEAFAQAANAISASTRQLINSAGRPQDIVVNVKGVGQGSSAMIKIAKMEANSETDPALQAAMLDAVKRLADTTGGLLNSAKAAAQAPQDESAQRRMVQGARALDAQARDMADQSIRRAAVANLVKASKDAAASCTQLIQVSKPSARENSSPQAANNLINAAKATAVKVTGLVSAVKTQQMSPQDTALQGKLITAAKDVAIPASQFVNAAKSAAPSVTDDGVRSALTDAARDASQSMQKLLMALKEAKAACGGLEFDGAIEAINNAKSHLDATAASARNNRLVPEFGQTPQSTFEDFTRAQGGVDRAVDQLLKSTQEHDPTTAGIAARDVGGNMRLLSNAVRGVSATSEDDEVPYNLTAAAKLLADALLSAVSAAKNAAADPDNDLNVEELLQAVGGVKDAMDDMARAMPGQRECDDAITAIQDASDFSRLPPSNAAPKQLQDDFASAARNLAGAAQEFVSNVHEGPEALGGSARNVSGATTEVLRIGKEAAGNTNDRNVQGQIVNALSGLSDSVQVLLGAGANAAGRPDDEEAAQAVDDGQLGVNSALNDLSDLLAAAGPGQIECNQAVKDIQEALKLFAAPQVGEDNFFDLLKKLKDAAQGLARSTTQLMNAAKTDADRVGPAASSVSDNVTDITAAAAGAAALVGGDTVSLDHFYGPAEEIKDSVNALRMARGQAKPVIAGCTDIAKSSQNLINAARAACKQVEDPEAKQAFKNLAREVAADTQGTVVAGKRVATTRGEGVDDLKNAAAGLQDHVGQLVQLAEAHLDRSALSPDAKHTQQKIKTNAKGVAAASSQLLNAAKSTAANPQDVPSQQQMHSAAGGITTSLARLIEAVQEAAPGAAACRQAMNDIAGVISDLDTASMAASVDALDPVPGVHPQDARADLLNATKQLTGNSVRLVQAAKARPHELGPAAASVAAIAPQLADNAVAMAAASNDPVEQQEALMKTKDVAEALLNLVSNAKDTGGDVENQEGQMRLEESSREVSSSMGELVNFLRGQLEGTAELENAAATVRSQLQLLANPSDNGKDYKSNLNDLLAASKALAGSISRLVSAAKSNPDAVGGEATGVAAAFPAVVGAAGAAAAASGEPEIAASLTNTTTDLGNATAGLIDAAAALQGDRANYQKQQAVSKAGQEVSLNLAKLMGATKDSSSAVKACANAIDAIGAAVTDMDTVAMFAASGHLEKPRDVAFSDFRDGLKDAARALTMGGSNVAKLSKSRSPQLASEANSVASQVENLVDLTKQAAPTLASGELQRELFDHTRGVAEALSGILDSARVVYQNPRDAGANQALQDSSQGVAGAISSYVNSLKHVNAENSRGLIAARNARDNITAAITEYDSRNPSAQPNATVEDMVDSSRGVTTGALALVSGARSTPEALESAAANMEQAVVDLLQKAKAAAAKGDDAAAVDEANHIVKDVAGAANNLLSIIHDSKGLVRNQQVGRDMGDAAKAVGDAVASVGQVARRLKSGFFDPNDPNQVAERELLAAAASIEAAASKLSELKPATDILADMDLDFAEQILEAAKAIAAATAALVKASIQSQREIVQAGKARSADNVFHADPVWQEGLVSAAKSVAASTNELCNSANAVANGEEDSMREERLIAAAQGVSSNTQHLVHAALAKAPPGPTTDRLKGAARMVRNATGSLVESAQAVAQAQEDALAERAMFNVDEGDSAVTRIKQRNEATARVLALERQLREAQNQAKALNEESYVKARAAKPKAKAKARAKAKSRPKGRPKSRAPPPAKRAPAAATATASSAAGGSSGGGAIAAGSFTYEQLKAGVEGADPTRLEEYLSDAEFAQVFSMDRAAFNALPGWKKTNQKRSAGLY